jgi:hypothetical protein
MGTKRTPIERRPFSAPNPESDPKTPLTMPGKTYVVDHKDPDTNSIVLALVNAGRFCSPSLKNIAAACQTGCGK